MDIQVSQYHLLKEILFLYCVLFGTLRSVECICMDLFLDSILLHRALGLYCFDYYSFVKCFKIRMCDASDFVLFAQDCFSS